MTRRALLWCGQVRREGQEKDYPVCVQDLDLAYRAAVRLGVAKPDIWAFVCRDYDLLPVGFEGIPCDATVAELRRVTQAIAATAADDDALLFVATNHGEQESGLLVSTPRPDPFGGDLPEAPDRLTPEILGDCLDQVPGPQVLLLGACYSGIFKRLGTERRLVLAACDDTIVNTEFRGDTPCSAFLTPIFEYWTGESLGGFAPPPERLALDEAFERVRAGSHQYLLIQDRQVPITPVRAGSASWPDEPPPTPGEPAPRRRRSGLQ